jgi:hypothetical protein
MPGTFTSKRFADGRVPATMSPIFSVGAGERAYVKFANFYNVSTSTVVIDVRIYSADSGTTRKWRRIELEQNESYDLLEYDRSVELSPGDSIQASATIGNTIDYVITGVIET